MSAHENHELVEGLEDDVALAGATAHIASRVFEDVELREAPPRKRELVGRLVRAGVLIVASDLLFRQAINELQSEAR